ncbi:MAG: ornithine aminomutase [Gammaproteobacteria bacterium SG8_11]|nr:MAG: ornithine aminomutase [Gammaproteobacteria bacterium SG8_11]
MSSIERPDDFAERREHLQSLSDSELHNYFWELVDQIVAPLIEEARTHTSPSIERSVLLRMGFSSIEAKAIVKQMGERQLLAHGAGHLILELAKANDLSIREAGLGLLDGQYWEQLPS